MKGQRPQTCAVVPRHSGAASTYLWGAQAARAAMGPIPHTVAVAIALVCSALPVSGGASQEPTPQSAGNDSAAVVVSGPGVGAHTTIAFRYRAGVLPGNAEARLQVSPKVGTAPQGPGAAAAYPSCPRPSGHRPSFYRPALIPASGRPGSAVTVSGLLGVYDKGATTSPTRPMSRFGGTSISILGRQPCPRVRLDSGAGGLGVTRPVGGQGGRKGPVQVQSAGIHTQVPPVPPGVTARTQSWSFTGPVEAGPPMAQSCSKSRPLRDK